MVSTDMPPASGDDHEVRVVELSNSQLRIQLVSIGASISRVSPTDDAATVCLALAGPDDYRHNPAYIGCTVGPVANRIGVARFEIDGQRYEVEPNEGPNQLHGGPDGFGHRPWALEHHRLADAARFVLRRPAGEGGYPGNLEVAVTWTLRDEAVRFEWTATTDAPTPVSLSNHAYWNLAPGDGPIDDHRLRVDAGRLVEVGPDLIPTGHLADVADSPFDLRAPSRLGDVIDGLSGPGIDHCYVLDPGGSARLIHESSGRTLDVETSLPGIQVYTGHDLDGSRPHGGHGARTGICLETQFLPDSVNQPGFPDCVIRPGQIAHHWTEYVLGFDRRS